MSSTSQDVPMDGVVEDTINGEINLNGNKLPVPSTHDVSLVGEHAQDIKSVAERLQEAVDAAWPTRGHNQYSRVYVLMLYWEEDDLGVAEEVWALQNIFMTSYYYSVRVFEIPSAKPTTRLQTRIAEFLKHDGPNTLLIVYYAGHAIQDQQRGQPPIWISRRRNPAQLPSSTVQSLLAECDSDVLLIYDCCHAVPTTTGVTGRGVKEFLAACGFEGRAAEVGPDSFTFALTQELGRASYSPVSVCELYARLIDRLRTWKPCISTNESGQMRFNSAGKPLFERSRRTTPIHCTLTNEHKRRSIVLTPMPEDWMTETRPMKNKVVRPQDDEKYAPKEINECPQVILSVRVDTEQFNIDTWLEWIKDVPPEATKVKVEGVYGSLSTLLLLRMPITTWKLLPDDAAYSFVGFVTTENLISDLREQELTAALTSVDLKKRYVYDPSDPIQPVSNYSIKTEMELRDVKNAEKMASKGTATGTADDAADWTRDLMLMLHVEFQHQEQLANFIIELSRDYPFEPTEDKQRIQSILFDVLHFKLQQHKELASLISDLMHPMDQFDRFVNRVHQ